LMIASPASADDTESEKAATRPNIIVIMADDLGYGDTSVYDGWVRTPQLERMSPRAVNVPTVGP
jgi:arylsulfatase